VRTRGPGGESSLTLSGRPTAGCLAHQSEAPPGWSKRRDSLEQCPITKVKGGVRGSRARARGAILERRGSEMVESASARRKSAPFAGRRRKRVSAGSCATEGCLQPLRHGESATRVLGSNHEEGRSPSGESFARALSTRAKQLRFAGGAGAARHEVRRYAYPRTNRERDRGRFLGR